MMCSENTILQFGSFLKILDISMSKSSTLFLDELVVASLIFAWTIKYSGCFLIIGIK